MSWIKHVAPVVALTTLRYLEQLNRLILGICILIIAALLFINSYAVIMREFFDTTYNWTMELSRHALLWIIFLPLGYAQLMGQHIKVDAFTSRLSKPMQTRLGIVTSAASLFAFIIFTWGAARYASTSLERDWDTGPIYYWPQFPILVVMPIGLGMLSLQLFITLLKHIAVLFTRQYDNN